MDNEKIGLEKRDISNDIPLNEVEGSDPMFPCLSLKEKVDAILDAQKELIKVMGDCLRILQDLDKTRKAGKF